MRYWAVFAAFSLGIVALFCGVGGDDPSRIAVTGTVTLDGQPLESGAVRFILKSYADQPHVDVGLIKDGAYATPSSDVLIPGTYQVQIRTDVQESSFKRGTRDASSAPSVQASRVPARYNDQSVLEVTINRGGTSQFDFDLKR
jgi:hypothetical protein